MANNTVIKTTESCFRGSSRVTDRNMQNFNMDAARQNYRRRISENQTKRLALFKKAQNNAEAIINMLIKKYNPSRIYQWGSVLLQEQFDENSDIDIAVEGVKSAEQFFALYGDAMKLSTFPLDLVEMEKIDPMYADSIRTKGKCVYESE